MVETNTRRGWNEGKALLHLKLRVFYVYKFKHLMLCYKLLSVHALMECLQEGIYSTMFLLTFCSIGFCVLIIVSKNLSTQIQYSFPKRNRILCKFLLDKRTHHVPRANFCSSVQCGDFAASLHNHVWHQLGAFHLFKTLSM